MHGRPPFNVSAGGNVLFDYTIIEICTFIPQSLVLPILAMRLVRNGVTRKDLAKAQLYASGQLTIANLKTCEDRIQKQFSDGGKEIYGGATWNAGTATAQGPENDLTAARWAVRSNSNEVFRHYKLTDIVDCVHPESLANRQRPWPIH